MATYYASTSGRMVAIVVSPTLTTDTVDYTTALASLAAALAANPVTNVIAEITSLSITNPFSGEGPRSLTIESSADDQGVLYGDVIRGGVAGYTLNIAGQFNGANAAMFRNGTCMAAAFLVKKATAAGWKTCTGRINNFQVTGIQAQSGVVQFTCTFEGSGLFPAFS